MQLKNKALSIVGCLAIGLSMTAGVAMASDADTGVSLTVECNSVDDVQVTTGFGALETVDLAAPIPATVQTTSPMTVRVDVGCDLSPWHVDAEITRFQNGLFSLAGDRFSLSAVPGSVTASNGLLPDPVASGADFDPISGPPFGDAESDSAIFETQNILQWALPFLPPAGPDFPAPFVSTAQFNGHLNLVNAPLAEGEYTATLTVILTVND